MARPSLTLQSDRAVPGGRQFTAELCSGRERVPAIVLAPPGERRAPGALLLHGYSSEKERMVASAGRALLRHGIATLAIDLPLHGERASGAAGLSQDELRNPIALARRWRAALTECGDALSALAALPQVDPTRISIVGYSMGSYLGLMVAAPNPQVRALVLAAGGDLPRGIPFEPVIRSLVDPLRAVTRLRGRPLLMVNGRRDRTITPDQAERLYAAAGEPKRIIWYDGGHWLPDQPVREAAEWLGAQL